VKERERNGECERERNSIVNTVRIYDIHGVNRPLFQIFGNLLNLNYSTGNIIIYLHGGALVVEVIRPRRRAYKYSMPSRGGEGWSGEGLGRVYPVWTRYIIYTAYSSSLASDTYIYIIIPI